MELLIDTDFIVKMGRYQLLSAFVVLMKAHGHIPPPIRYLYEIRTMLDKCSVNPINSVFGSKAGWGASWSFVTDGVRMDAPTDYAMLDELDEIPGIDNGEALLVEYLMRAPDTVIVTADKKFAYAMAHPKAKRFRDALKQRIIHMEHIVFALGNAKSPEWPDLRKLIWTVPTCDAVLHGLLDKKKSESDAIADLWKSARGLNSSSAGTMPAPVCPPYNLIPKTPPPPPPL